jgi:hypothetical protein
MLAASFFTRLLAPHPQSAEAMARFFLLSRVPVHLPAAGLPLWKLNRTPQPLWHADDSFVCLGKESVVVAGNEEGNPHCPPLNNCSIFLMMSIVYP